MSGDTEDVCVFSERLIVEIDVPDGEEHLIRITGLWEEPCSKE